MCPFIELLFLTQLNYISFDSVFGLQGLVDMNKPPEMISGNMTAGRNLLGIVSHCQFDGSRQTVIDAYVFMQPCVYILDSL